MLPSIINLNPYHFPLFINIININMHDPHKWPKSIFFLISQSRGMRLTISLIL
jgi:hypothetical protein